MRSCRKSLSLLISRVSLSSFFLLHSLSLLRLPSRLPPFSFDHFSLSFHSMMQEGSLSHFAPHGSVLCDSVVLSCGLRMSPFLLRLLLPFVSFLYSLFFFLFLVFLSPLLCLCNAVMQEVSLTHSLTHSASQRSVCLPLPRSLLPSCLLSLVPFCRFSLSALKSASRSSAVLLLFVILFAFSRR